MYTCVTDRPVAIDSYDHIYPAGTLRDNSRNIEFNKKLYKLFSNKHLSILDLGCAGGGFVHDCLLDGHTAFGIDGSDTNKNTGRAEWSLIPEFLFTADIRYPFSIKESDETIYFDVITAWEVLEHIETDKLPNVWSNITTNLKLGGLFICSIPEFGWSDLGVELHRTIQKCAWWEEQLNFAGLHRHKELETYFDNQWIRSTSCLFVTKK